MRDSEFIELAERTLSEIERKLERFDCSMVSDGVLEIEFNDGGQIVVTRHLALQEIWLAARSGGVHFRWDGKAWRGTRDGRELMSVLSEIVSACTR